jgi:hypothetical protein
LARKLSTAYLSVAAGAGKSARLAGSGILLG